MSAGSLEHFSSLVVSEFGDDRDLSSGRTGLNGQNCSHHPRITVFGGAEHDHRAGFAYRNPAQIGQAGRGAGSAHDAKGPRGGDPGCDIGVH
jgi:hypothetical protein